MQKSTAVSTLEESGSSTNKIWQAALAKYYSELRKGGIKSLLIDRDLWDIDGPDDLLAQIQALAPPDETNSKNWATVLNQLRPILLGLNDFAAIITWAFGMDGKVAAVIWGSIRLIIRFAQPVLPEVIEMLGELQRSLPRIRQYEEELPMTEALESALVDMYTELIIFCAHAITFFRNNPNVGLIRTAWLQFNSEFTTVVKKLRSYARRVDEAADMARLSREKRATETLAAIQGIRRLNIGNAKLPCYSIPYGLNLRFFGRLDEAERMKTLLDPVEPRTQMRVLAMYGLGGVGKTQLALHYANTSMKEYDVVAWIPAETQIKLVQALSSLAVKLGLVENEVQDDYQSLQKVRDWLNTTNTPFLLIFDNVDDDGLLEQIWPATAEASVIITTRSPSVAAKRTMHTMNLQPFQGENASAVLYAMTGMGVSDEEEKGAATEVCRLLGGLPLAFMQISAYIRDRGCSYQEFLHLYRKSAEKVIRRSEAPPEYGQSLLTTWNMSLQKLLSEAKTLLNVLAFFDPDMIPERLIVNTQASIEDPRLEFLFDEFDFGDAVMELIRASLVSRLASSKSLSLHRLVKFATLSKISSEEKRFYFENIVRILSYDFPNTWNKRGSYQGHGYQSWETCSAVLPHVGSLMEAMKEFKIEVSEPEDWAGLVFRSGTYLWEKELPTQGRKFFEFGLDAKINPLGPNAAQAYRLLGHISLDMARPNAALEAYRKALAIRQKLEEPDSPPIADVYDSIACSYTEAGRTTDAFEFVEKATTIHLRHDASKMARTEAIRALTCLRAGQADESLEALRRCWELQGLTQEQIEKSKYPKHSGDIVLMARIKWQQGHKTEAQELASRTIAIRRGAFGEHGGPRVVDSMFIVGRMLQEKGEDVLAAKLFHEIIGMSGEMMEMKGHRARALWFLANAEEKIGDSSSAVRLRKEAKEVRSQITSREGEDEDSNEGFMKLVSWMLW
ncbi:tpr repeat-containing protein [Hypomontagnella monticulosa]|nr:tpr repeat-containing protein [Hypomontagnella monticulosa]